MDTQTVIDLDESPAGCVARGAALLDRMRPGWRQALRGQAIHMTDGQACVAAQVFGDWGYAKQAIGEDQEPDRHYPWASDGTMSHHGFIVWDSEHGDMDEPATDALLPLWQAEINR
jgi:hypothetical protein